MDVILENPANAGAEGAMVWLTEISQAKGQNQNINSLLFSELIFMGIISDGLIVL